MKQNRKWLRPADCKQSALAHYNICPKCPFFTATQEWRHQCHCLTALSITYWSRQGCKRDLIFRDRDVWKFVRDEADTFRDSDRDIFEVCRDRCLLLSFWLQTATNYAVFRPFITQNTVQCQRLFYRNFRAFSQRLSAIWLKKLFCSPTFMHYVLTI